MATTSEEEKKQNVSPSLPNDDDAYAAFRKTLPVNLRDTKDADYEQGGDYRSRRYWELSGKPKDFNEGLKNNMFTKEDDGFYHSPSVAYNKEKDEYEFMKSRNHPTFAKELHWYNGDKDGAPEFRKNYIIDKSGDYYRYVRRNAAPPSSPQDGGQSAVNTQTKTGSGTTTTTTTTTDTTTYTPYEQFKGNNYAELEDYLRNQLIDEKPETKEEREKREKREKRIGFLARIADGLGTLHTAFSHARGVKPMDMPQMSARATELYEKAKREREKDKDRYMNYAITLGKIRDANRDFGFKKEQAKLQQQNADRQYQFQQDRAKADDDKWQKKYDADQEQAKWQRAHGDRQLDLAEKAQAAQDRHNRAMEGIQRAQNKFQQQIHDNSQMFTLGEGQGSVIVPRAAINSHNFSVVYNSLPEEYRVAKGTPIYEEKTDVLGKKTKVISGYNPPSAEQMAIAVGAYLGDQAIPVDKKTATRTALAQLGKKTGGDNKTMPGVK